jgi:hypothetical protein
MSWATFWAISSQTHPVTLAVRNICTPRQQNPINLEAPIQIQVLANRLTQKERKKEKRFLQR